MKKQDGRDLNGKEMCQMLEEFCNSMYKEEMKAFTEQLVSRTHRTLQQRIMSLFIACIEHWSNQTDFDMRNEATIKLAKKIIENTGDKYDRALPLI